MKEKLRININKLVYIHHSFCLNVTGEWNNRKLWSINNCHPLQIESNVSLLCEIQIWP